LMVGSGQYHICRVSVGDTNILNFDEAEIVRIGPNQSTLDGPGTGVEDIGDQTLVDPLWINSPDVISIEMRPQNYVGPYVGCPPERTIDRVRIGTMLPKGLVQESGMSWRVEAQLIDDFEVPQGAWETIGTHSETDESNVPVRMHNEYELTPGRYWFRKIRTDGTTNPNLAELDQLDWLDLQGHLVDADINVTDCTFIAIKIRATGQLSGGLRFRVMSRRMLPVWDGSVWSDPQLTRSPAWAFAQVLRSRGIPDASIDLDALLALAPIWEARFDSFDFKFDTLTSTWEALSLITKVGRAIPLIRGSRYTVVRDGPETLPVAAYGMRNIRRGSMSLSPSLAASDSMRTLDAEYFDHRRWTWITVTSQIHNGQIYTYRGEVERAALGIPVPDENRRGRIKFSGIIGENHAKRTVAYTLADAYYRSASVSIDTELDGQLPAPLNLVLFQHDVGDFGQGGDIVSFDDGTDTIETTEPLVWSDGAHAIRLQKPDGSLTSAITVTPGVDDYHAVLGSAPGFTLSTEDANRERTRYVFGPQTQVGALCKVRSITPSDERKFGLRLVLEDNRVHTVDAAFIADDPLPPCVVEEEVVEPYWVNPSGGTDRDFDISEDGLTVSEEHEFNAYAYTYKSETSGKWYLEGVVGLNEFGDCGCTFGIRDNYYITSDGVLWRREVSYFNGFPLTAPPGFTDGSNVGLAWDIDAGKMWIYLDGVLQGGDPVAGTGPADTFVHGGLGVSFLFAAANDAADHSFTLLLTPTYTPPSGFNYYY
jgi:hypothetical protein